MNFSSHRWCLLMAMCVFACSDGGGQALERPAKTPPVRVASVTSGYAAEVQLIEGRGVLILQLSPQDKAAPEVALPMSRRVEFWKPLLEQLFREHGRKPELFLTVGEYPELNGRIATAAAASGRWDLKTGKPRRGDAGAEVVKLLSSGGMLLELDALFDPLGYRVAVAEAENVMVRRWKESGGKTDRPVPPDALVPGGASLTFRLLAKSPTEN